MTDMLLVKKFTFYISCIATYPRSSCRKQIFFFYLYINQERVTDWLNDSRILIMRHFVMSDYLNLWASSCSETFEENCKNWIVFLNCTCYTFLTLAFTKPSPEFGFDWKSLVDSGTSHDFSCYNFLHILTFS